MPRRREKVYKSHRERLQPNVSPSKLKEIQERYTNPLVSRLHYCQVALKLIDFDVLFASL